MRCNARRMWIGDQSSRYCPDCEAWGHAEVIAVADDYRSIDSRCPRGHTFHEDLIACEAFHLNPPEPPKPPPRFSVHRGLSEHGPWTRGADVATFESGRRVIHRWRSERPDVWCMLACDGRPVVRTRPRRDSESPLAVGSARIMALPARSRARRSAPRGLSSAVQTPSLARRSKRE